MSSKSEHKRKNYQIHEATLRAKAETARIIFSEEMKALGKKLEDIDTQIQQLSLLKDKIIREMGDLLKPAQDELEKCEVLEEQLNVD